MSKAFPALFSIILLSATCQLASRSGSFGMRPAMAGQASTSLSAPQSHPRFSYAHSKRPLPKHVSGEIVVKLKGSALDRSIQSSIRASLEGALGARALKTIRTFRTDDTLQTLKIARDSDLKDAIEALEADPNVEYAEPNMIYHRLDDGIPDDVDFGKLWGMRNTGQTDAAGQVGTPGSDIGVVSLWKQGITGSRKVVVAVIDTGIDWTHPDLVDNLYTNPGEIADNGKDDDGNGFIDDVHGWNFDSHTNQSSDDHDHGTHCAGTIGGVGNNHQGVAGVNWEVTLMPVKFLSKDGGGTLEGAVEAINYARMMKANIMSNSWGGGGFTQAMLDSIEAAKKDGILFVAAAGNDQSDNDSTPSYPASYEAENVISVAASDNQDRLASFSNWGSKSVHVAAPGVKIYSSVKGGRYDTFSGTSMATPHVAGIAALMLSHDSSLTFSDIKERLIRTSDPIRGLRSKVMAHGRVNAANAVNNVVPPSTEPDESAWKTQDYALESDHPYPMNADRTYQVKVPGAKYVRVIFEKLEVEQSYDKVLVQESTGAIVDELSGSMTEKTSEYVAGDTLTLRLKSDDVVNGYGFKISKVQFIQ